MLKAKGTKIGMWHWQFDDRARKYPYIPNICKTAIDTKKSRLYQWFATPMACYTAVLGNEPRLSKENAYVRMS